MSIFLRRVGVQRAGVTLISTLVGVGIFALLSVSVYSAITATARGMRTYREKSTVSALADQYMEIARNLSYSQVGTLNGNPPGSLPDEPNSQYSVYNNVRYQIYYVVTYVDDPADGTALAGTDPAPTDYKQVKLYIKNTSTALSVPFVTNITPRGLENLVSGGALLLQVIDAVGQPVPGATIHITNTATTPDIDLTRTADANGKWVEVGLPDSATSYHVVVTKANYSSDQTYPSTVQNPNPSKPDATISNGQVTQISFSIDKQSSLTLQTVDTLCQPLSGMGLALRGTKLIGTPNVLKFDNTYSTDGQGNVVLSSLDWDTYTPAVTQSGYMIYGSSPIQQIAVFPDTNQVASLILGPSTANSLLIIVKDATTGNPLEGASVRIENLSSSYDTTKLTAGSTLYQQDWTNGAGQSNFSALDRYFDDDGNVDVTTVPTGVRLENVSGTYAPSANLTSSSFDTGTASTSYTTFTWNPTSQSPSTTLAFQVATNNDNSSWNFVGPDDTEFSYYTNPGTTISASHANHRYLRYKSFLSTASSTITPVLSNVTVNYVSGCFAPGQTMFAGLTAGSNYRATVSMGGYQTQQINSINISGYNVLEVLLSP